MLTQMNQRFNMKQNAFALLGLVLMAVSFNFFFVPNKIAPGGVTGLATIIYYLWGFPVGVVSAVINIPLFLLSWKSMGRMFAIRSFIAMILLSVLLDLLPIYAVTQDMLLASAVGGVLLGVGLGLVVLGNATTGGTDLATAMLHKLFPHASFGMILMVIESSIVLISAFTLGAEVTLYAVVAIVISSKIIDMMQAGVNEGRLFFVVCSKPDELSAAIMENLERGVTILNGTGAYTKQDRPVLFCVVGKNQVYPFKRLVHEVDQSAFVVLANVTEAMGEGFGQIMPPKSG